MAHLLTPAPSTATTAFSTRARKSSSLYTWRNVRFNTRRVCCLSNQYQHHQVSDQGQVPPTRDDQSLRRRALMGLSGAVSLGLSLRGEQSASGKGRPPPPPPREKKDPNLSGVQAKVLASKKRKEAMKETMTKLREKGKVIGTKVDPPPPPAPVPPITTNVESPPAAPAPTTTTTPE